MVGSVVPNGPNSYLNFNFNLNLILSPRVSSAYALGQNSNLPQFSHVAPALPPLAASTDPCVSFMWQPPQFVPWTTGTIAASFLFVKILRYFASNPSSASTDHLLSASQYTATLKK